MKQNLLRVFALMLMTASTLIAQNHRICGTMEYLAAQKSADPGLAARMADIENQTQRWISNHQDQKTAAVITVPVVVHVVYNGSAQNISDARIIEQINVLNKDYSRTNADAGNTPSVWQSIAANTQVQFCLAQRDPSGNATSGIVRKSTTTSSFSTNNNVKHNSTGGDDAWPAASYLNLWVCNLGGGLLGYSTFPGGSASVDGVVVLYSSVGGPNAPGTANPYHLGRTATHEVGHWLNLFHIWGDDGTSCSGTDNVSDTPNQADENYGCPTFPNVSCSNGPNGDMFMNYMDYTDDGCMNMFTVGQASRMQATLTGTRSSIQTSLGCTPPGSTCSVPSGLSASSITSSSATLNWTAVSGAVSYNVQYRQTGTSTWTSTTSSTNSKAVSGLNASTQYEFQVSTVCSGSSSAFSGSATFTTSAPPCNATTGMNTTNVADNSATFNWNAVSGALSYNVQYRKTGTSTWTSANTTATFYNVSGLTAGTGYEWQVQTVCSGGNSSFTSSTTFTTTGVAPCNTPTGTSTTSITTTSATFNWGAVAGAVSYAVQYRVVGTSTWTTGTSASTTFNATGLTAATAYEWQVGTVCSGSSSSYTASVNFTTSSISYCTSRGNNTTYEYINKVTLGSINNTSGNNSGYGNYTAQSTNLAGGTSNTIGLTPGFASSSYREYWNVWIDYNHNGVFTDAGERVAQGNSTAALNLSFTVPTTALNGSTRMRIQMQYNAYASTSCTTYTYGEVEDYSVNVTGNAQISVLPGVQQDSRSLKNLDGINLYPNPAQDNITIEFSSNISVAGKDNVYNMVGQKVISNNLSVVEGLNSINLNTSAFEKGVYLLEIENNGETLRQKFTISR